MGSKLTLRCREKKMLFVLGRFPPRNRWDDSYKLPVSRGHQGTVISPPLGLGGTREWFTSISAQWLSHNNNKVIFVH